MRYSDVVVVVRNTSPPSAAARSEAEAAATTTAAAAEWALYRQVYWQLCAYTTTQRATTASS